VVRGEQAATTHRARAPVRRDLTFLDTTIRGGMRLRGGPWEMEVWPERGGRITSLRLAGEELLEQGIGVDDQFAQGVVARGAWGWGEEAPHLEAAPHPGPGPVGAGGL